MKMVQINLDKERFLKYGVRAFITIEKELDTTMDKINIERQETLFVLLYAGLIHMDRKLTLDKVYGIVDKVVEERAEKDKVGFMEAYSEVMGEIGAKIGEAMGNDKQEEKPSE